jgi:hypothetical protein
MEPDFISFFNKNKIYHITEEEYDKFREEEDAALQTRPSCFNISHNRKFVIFKDQHFTYCKLAFASLIRVICDDTAQFSWFRFNKEPPNAAIDYISTEYKRILGVDSPKHHNVEYTIMKIIVSKYLDELKARDVCKPIVAEVLPEPLVAIAEVLPELDTYQYKSTSKPKAVEYMSKKPPSRKKKSIPLALKRKVWNQHIGENIGRTLCLCCKLSYITQMSFSCGHIVAEAEGGQLRLDNLRPICGSCNSSMGTKNMNEFIREYGL